MYTLTSDSPRCAFPRSVMSYPPPPTHTPKAPPCPAHQLAFSQRLSGSESLEVAVSPTNDYETHSTLFPALSGSLPVRRWSSVSCGGDLSCPLHAGAGQVRVLPGAADPACPAGHPDPQGLLEGAHAENLAVVAHPKLMFIIDSTQKPIFRSLPLKP